MAILKSVSSAASGPCGELGGDERPRFREDDESMLSLGCGESWLQATWHGCGHVKSTLHACTVGIVFTRSVRLVRNVELVCMQEATIGAQRTTSRQAASTFDLPLD
jgi:hypothetical protein